MRTSRPARLLWAAGLLLPLAAAAGSPPDFEKLYAIAVSEGGAAFTGFSAERGRRFFTSTHGNDWSCASCHTRNPSGPGVHATTGKEIAPLAPAANRRRFVDAAKVEKWFMRNCKDVLKRPCTPLEKGDVVAYLMSSR